MNKLIGSSGNIMLLYDKENKLFDVVVELVLLTSEPEYYMSETTMVRKSGIKQLRVFSDVQGLRSLSESILRLADDAEKICINEQKEGEKP